MSPSSIELRGDEHEKNKTKEKRQKKKYIKCLIIKLSKTFKSKLKDFLIIIKYL